MADSSPSVVYLKPAIVQSVSAAKMPLLDAGAKTTRWIWQSLTNLIIWKLLHQLERKHVPELPQVIAKPVIAELRVADHGNPVKGNNLH